MATQTLFITYESLVRDHDGYCSGKEASDQEDEYYIRRGAPQCIKYKRIYAIVHRNNVNSEGYLLPEHLEELTVTVNDLASEHWHRGYSGQCHGFGERLVAREAYIPRALPDVGDFVPFMDTLRDG